MYSSKRNSKSQRIRAALYYFSVLVFFIGLPFILSDALGYKFNRRTLKFTKTGLVVLKTQPPGANIYLDKTLLNEKTPATINELLPGKYNLELELEGHYPYATVVEVKEGKVCRLEKIILFPLRAEVKKLNKDVIDDFFIDESKEKIYYIRNEDNSIYRSDLDGSHFESISNYLPILPPPKKWKISPDKEKLLYFNSHQIGIVMLEPDKESLSANEVMFVIQYPYGNINEVFWHSDSFHLILVTQIKIEIQEARPDATVVPAVILSKRNADSFYDPRSDTLYFLDSQKAGDGKLYDNVYKLDLSEKIYPLQELMKMSPVFEEIEPEKDGQEKKQSK